MKRSPTAVLLTLAAVAATAGRAHGQTPAGTVGITELVPVVGGTPARLCPGARNSVRIGVTWRGAAPAPAVALRLQLVTRGGPPDGVLLAEGTARPQPAPASTTFTFLNVDIPARLRGRGALLAVRAEPESDTGPDGAAGSSRSISIDTSTDWSCSGGGAPVRLQSKRSYGAQDPFDSMSGW